MTWLSGVPRRTRSLRWPLEATQFRQKSLTAFQNVSGTSILDDRIFHFISYLPEDGPPETSVYLADLKDASDVIPVHQIAHIPLYLLSVEPLPCHNETTLFVSVEFNQKQSRVTLRTHANDGTIVRQRLTSAEAAYGRLVVHANMVALCISSGKEPTQEPEYFLSDPNRYKRIDYISGFSDFPRDLFADQIICWDTTGDHIHIIDIPQAADSPMLHWGDFQFITADKIALAGCVEASVCDVNVAVLKCFSKQGGYERTFAQSSHPERDSIYRYTGISCSSATSNIFLHYHDSGSRLSVFHRDLLSGHIASQPDVDQCASLHSATEHRSYHRILRGELNIGLSSVAGNRALMRGSMNSYSSDDLSLFILDFDHERVSHLLDLDASARGRLCSRLAEEDACVKVVTRRSILYPFGEETDGEYPWPEPRHPDWEAHLRVLHSRDKDRFEGRSAYPALEYDESPLENRNQALFGFVASKVKLPDWVDVTRVAITSSALVQIPDLDLDDNLGWYIFDLED